MVHDQHQSTAAPENKKSVSPTAPPPKSPNGAGTTSSSSSSSASYRQRLSIKAYLRKGSRDDSFLPTGPRMPTIRERENSTSVSGSGVGTPSSRDGKSSSIFSSLDDSSLARDSQCALFDYADLEIDFFEGGAEEIGATSGKYAGARGQFVAMSAGSFYLTRS